MFRETVSNADGTLLRQRHRPRPVRSVGGAPGLQEIQPPRRPPRGRQDHDARCQMAVGGLEETVTVVRRIAHRRHHLEGSRRQCQRPRARRAALGEQQLRRLRRAAAGGRSEHQHGVVRQRLGDGQRPGSAQQQLHARRRQQQRRRDRAARGHAGAHADRGGAGIPGLHQPVRRRVRPYHRRDHQRRDQAGHQRLSRQPRSGSSRTPG